MNRGLLLNYAQALLDSIPSLGIMNRTALDTITFHHGRFNFIKWLKPSGLPSNRATGRKPSGKARKSLAWSRIF